MTILEFPKRGAAVIKQTLIHICPIVEGEAAEQFISMITNACRDLKAEVSIEELQNMLEVGQVYLVRFDINGEVIAEVKVTQ